MVSIPPAATVNAPSNCPADQFITALLATVSGAFILPPEQVSEPSPATTSPPSNVPPDQFMVPCKMLALVQLAKTVPTGWSTKPVVFKSHWMVVVPVPAVFRNVPALINVFGLP